MTKDDLEMILKFIGGLGMFLYGMNVMADGLQKSAGGRLKKLMEFLTKNRLVLKQDQTLRYSFQTELELM